MSPALNILSETLPEEEVKRYGCFTTLTSRRSLATDICDDALTCLKQDWTHRMGSSKADREPGLENDLAGNCVLLALPDGTPERLWHVAYLAGLTFHLDDITEVMACRDAYHNLAVQFDEPLSCITSASDQSGSMVRDLLRPIVDEMLALDPSNTVATLAAWKGYFAALGSRQKKAPSTIEEYIPFRLDDFGCNHWLAMLRFSMDLHLTEKDMEEVRGIVHAAMISVVLTNDWHSWAKELAAYQQGRGKLCNAVAVLMGQHTVSAEVASDMLKELAITAERTYAKLRDQWVASSASYAEDAAKYVEAVGALAAGTSVWSASCPRYNSHRSDMSKALAVTAGYATSQEESKCISSITVVPVE